MFLLAHWSPKFFDPVVLSTMLICHEKKSFIILMVYLFTKVSNKLLLGNHLLETFKIVIFLPDSHEYFAYTVQAFLPFCIFGTSLDLLDSSHNSINCYFSLWFNLLFTMLPNLPLKYFRSWCFKYHFQPNDSVSYVCTNNQLDKTDQSIN